MFPRLRGGSDQQGSSGNRKQDKEFGFHGNGGVGMRLFYEPSNQSSRGECPSKVVIDQVHSIGCRRIGLYSKNLTYHPKQQELASLYRAVFPVDSKENTELDNIDPTPIGQKFRLCP